MHEWNEGWFFGYLGEFHGCKMHKKIWKHLGEWWKLQEQRAGQKSWGSWTGVVQWVSSGVRINEFCLRGGARGSVELPQGKK